MTQHSMYVPEGIPETDRDRYFATMTAILNKRRPAILEVRCKSGGHLLIGVYSTQWGDLAVSKLRAPTRKMRGFPAAGRTTDRGEVSGVLLAERDRIRADCRCGARYPVETATVRAWIAEARRSTKQPVVRMV